MNIGQPLRDLGAVESQSLREAILALEEPVWQEEQLRQKKYSDVHYNTESVILIFCDLQIHCNRPSNEIESTLYTH